MRKSLQKPDLPILYLTEVQQKVTETLEKDYFCMIARSIFRAGSYKQSLEFFKCCYKLIF